MMTLPFLTLPDPLTTGEGVLDPLGLALVGERLADQILPGLRARMSRVRFVTAIAVGAAVCEGLEDFASDGVTPPYLVFEWLVVEAFIRASERNEVRGTPGIFKAQTARDTSTPLCAKTYLHVPTIFGFHGVYKPLARHLGIVDDDLRLADNGYELLKKWQTEQGLDGFMESSVSTGSGRSVRQTLRSAVEDGLHESQNTRSGAWQGWSLLAKHLAPGAAGVEEAAFLTKLIHDARGGTRGEVFDLIQSLPDEDETDEALLVKDVLLAKASSTLRPQLDTIIAYESMCTLLEDGFDWIRYLSTRAGARAITATEFGSQEHVKAVAGALPSALHRVETALESWPLTLQQQFGSLAKAFQGVDSPQSLFEATLSRHAEVQKAKQPDGKREWFERAPNGGVMVRIPYRTNDAPAPRVWWSRPYRVTTARAFLSDLREAVR